MASAALSVEKIRKDFPILSRKVNGKRLIYLDNAATSQKPRQVIAAIREYYENHNANVHRGIHKLSEEATEAYEAAHEKAAGLINSGFQEIIFTKNTTESINLLAYSLTSSLKKGDEIVLTEAEHHSNMVPWQQIARQRGLSVKFARTGADGTLDMGHYESLMTRKTRIVSAAHVSNVLGTVNPIRKMAETAHRNGAIFVADAAQSAPHMPLDVKQLGCDFAAFSSHKMLGPTGIGVLYGKQELLDKMQPFLYGGDMIREVTYTGTRFNELPWKFEAGTPNIAGGIGFGAAIDYLRKTGMEAIREHEKKITAHCLKLLLEQHDVEIYGPAGGNRAGIVSFNIKGVHAHDTAAILDQEGIAIRGGHHCAMPLMGKMGIGSSARASFYLYNTRQEAEKLAESLEKIRAAFRKKQRTG